MNYSFGKIDPSLIGDFVNIEYPSRRQFRDDETVERWKSIGHLYVNYTGLLREEYRGLPKWCYKISEYFKDRMNISKTSMSVYCMPPGTIMPEHRDMYHRYKDINDIDDDDICRILVFLDDWKSGHYFEIEDTPVINWKSGDYCIWYNDASHIAANIGRENRYTLQITAKVEK